jgi:hypothetical protein
MLSEAASLRHVSSLYHLHSQRRYPPAIVIVAVDVQDLLALDTEDTANLSINCLDTRRTRVTLKARIQ